MIIHFANRGAKVLYDFLVSNNITGTFLLPANICESVPATFHVAGCNVHYVDIDAKTLCIDEKQVINQINDYVGLLAVHTYGLQSSFDSLYSKVRHVNQNAIIIDDRCLCWPDFETEGLYDNAEADLTLFSLGNKKQVQLGIGGVGIVKEQWQIEDVNVGDNSMFNNVSFIFDKTKYLCQKKIAKAHIKKIQTIYAKNLPKEIQLPMEFNNWRFNIRVNAEIKEQIINSLFDDKLFASSHYKSLAEDAERMTPNTVKLQQEIINIFIDQKYYSEHQAFRTCQVIQKIMKQSQHCV